MSVPGRWSLFFPLVPLLLFGVVQPGFALESTEKTIEEKTSTYELTVAYPQFGSPAIDTEIEDFAKGEVAGFKSSLAERVAKEPPYTADLAYTIARNDDEVLAILFTYSYYMGGAHPNMNRFSFNYLMPEGTRVYLPELFTREGLKRVSELAIADLKAANAGPDGGIVTEAGAGPYSENFGAFVLDKDQLVIYFDPYQVLPYAAGPQETHIPLAKLMDVRRADPREPLPSFDCAKAATATEHAICGDAALARLDREVGDSYALRLVWAQPEDRAGQKNAQRDWLAVRDKTCASTRSPDLVKCLTEQYSARLTQLRTQP